MFLEHPNVSVAVIFSDVFILDVIKLHMEELVSRMLNTTLEIEGAVELAQIVLWAIHVSMPIGC